MQLYALPDGRHIAIGEHASIRELDAVQAHVGQFEHAVVLDRGEVDDHHAHVERQLRDAHRRIAALEAAAPTSGTGRYVLGVSTFDGTIQLRCTDCGPDGVTLLLDSEIYTGGRRSTLDRWNAAVAAHEPQHADAENEGRA